MHSEVSGRLWDKSEKVSGEGTSEWKIENPDGVETVKKINQQHGWE